MGGIYKSSYEVEFFMQFFNFEEESLLAKANYTTEKYFDVTLVCEGESFKSSRCILSIRSQVFRTMFIQDTLEKRTSVIEIDDFGAETVRRMLKFLHTDKVDADEIDLDLLAAADKYDIKLLFFICEEKLVADLQESNAISSYMVASLHCAPDLVLKSSKIIMKNIQSFKTDPDYESLSKDNLTEIMTIASSCVDLLERPLENEVKNSDLLSERNLTVLQEHFSEFEKDGIITVQDFRTIKTRLNRDPTEEELQELQELYSKIDLPTFLTIVARDHMILREHMIDVLKFIAEDDFITASEFREAMTMSEFVFMTGKQADRIFRKVFQLFGEANTEGVDRLNIEKLASWTASNAIFFLRD